MTTAFLTWRAPASRTWYPIGRLQYDNALFAFSYTEGARVAHLRDGLQPLASFPDFKTRYLAEELFPLFSNRMLSRGRREYEDYVQWLSLAETDGDPVAFLARSGGKRATDTLEMFQSPERDASGKLRMHFFAHGLQHFSPESWERANRLAPGEPLLLMHDFQNEHDQTALMLRTSEQVPHDIYPVGYCPRYILEDVFRLLASSPNTVRVEVLRTNPPPAPVWFRLLCTLTADWPENYQPFSGPLYQEIEFVERVRHIYSDAARHSRWHGAHEPAT